MKRRGPGRWIWRIVRLPLIAYAVVVGLLVCFQERLIFPGAETRGRPDAVVEPPEGSELLHLRTASGIPIAALFGRALGPDGRVRPDAAARPTLLYFYGNGTWLKTAVHQFKTFRALGLNVMFPEYAGYGMSGGSPGELGCRETADAAYEALLACKDVAPGRLVCVGSSLGGAVAIDLASRRRVAGLAVFSSFTSLVEMAARQYPWVPVPLLLRPRFESERKIRQVHCPILIGHGTADVLVPEAMADRLARAAGGPVTRISIPGAGHNDVFQLGGDRLLSTLRRFAEEAHSP